MQGEPPEVLASFLLLLLGLGTRKGPVSALSVSLEVSYLLVRSQVRALLGADPVGLQMALLHVPPAPPSCRYSCHQSWSLIWALSTAPSRAPLVEMGLWWDGQKMPPGRIQCPHVHKGPSWIPTLLHFPHLKGQAPQHPPALCFPGSLVRKFVLCRARAPCLNLFWALGLMGWFVCANKRIVNLKKCFLVKCPPVLIRMVTSSGY